MNVQIARDVYKRFDEWCDRRNRVKKHTVTRLVQRLLQMEHYVQTAMLGDVDEGIEVAYAEALQALAAELVAKYKAREGVKTSGTRKGKPAGNPTRPPGQASSDPPPEPDATRRSG